MRLDVNLAQRLDQRMILAPRMIQSMEILQLPLMALQERIDHELQENPVLEIKDANSEEAPDEPVAESTADPVREPEGAKEEASSTDPDFDRLVELGDTWADHFNEEHRFSSNRTEEMSDKKHDALFNMAARPQSLQDYLSDQLAYMEAPQEILQLARYLISHIDERGYLSTCVDEIAHGLDGAIPLKRLAQALALVQKLDPPGVGARDYKECLLLQLTAETPSRDVVRMLILDHLEDIQHNRLPAIQKKTGFDLSAIHDGIEALKHLDPKPGRAFTSESVPYVVPDVIVERTESGDYEVKLLDDWVPSLYISRRYFELYRDKQADPKTKEFLKRKIQSAQWLIEAIEQRRGTLIKVTKAILRHQQAFLEGGPAFIDPLKMQQIADLVGVHVTTVSRAVDDKWVQTARGLFPLRRFFGGGTQTASGEDVAWEIIQRKLTDIVGHEDKEHPLSDEDLVVKLAESGYSIARRTVTKYRKIQNIQSSRKRRVWDTAGAAHDSARKR